MKMSLTKYQYVGPVNSSCTLRLGETEELDVLLLRGSIVEMPATHEYTQVLVAQGYLEAIPVAPSIAKSRKTENEN